MGMKIVTSDGTVLAYQEWGQGRPMVFVTPWGCPSELWQYTIEDFRGRGYRCVSFDRRGHGRSDVARDFSFARLVKDVAEVVETLDLRDVALVGYSLGGAEAMGYVAERAKGRVSQLVLLAPATPCVVQKPDYRTGIDVASLEGVRGQWREDFSRWVAEGKEPFFAGDRFGVPATTKDWLERLLLGTSLQVALASNAAMLEVDLRDAMRACRIPALVIHGDADASIPVQLGRASAELLPNAKYVELPGGPHGLPFTHRREIAERISEFLARGALRSAGHQRSDFR